MSVFENNASAFPCTSSYLKSNGFNAFDCEFRDISAGQLFNLLEKAELNIKWDVRESEDYQTILLARNHMFYTVNDSENLKNFYDYKIENVTSNTIILDLKEEAKKINTPIDLFNRINDFNINTLFNTSIYDYGTITAYFSENNIPKSKVDSSLTKQLLFRDNCKKVSENYFAVSRFNLIVHNITINSDIPNTVSEVYDNDKKNVISILGDIPENNIIEKTIYPEIISSSMEKDPSSNIFRSNEYLANALLTELRYIYQGSIIIKYNPQIEIGDTITLIDSVSNTYGIFEVDSVEHSLDDRGLITSLLVKSYWTLSDPILDYYSTEISFKLMNQFKNVNLSYIDKNNQDKISNIIGNYLKFIVQTPKYCSFYRKVNESLFYPSTVDDNVGHYPTAMTLRFYPMVKKGVAQIPNNIKYAFFKAPKNVANYYALFVILQAYANQIIGGALKSFASGFASASIFVADILISILTFDISEFFKPLLGITSNKALNKTFDDVDEVSEEVMLSMNMYNPYESKYNLMGNFDLTFGFFNTRLQRVEDLFAHKNVVPSKKLADEYLKEKVRVVKKILTDVFDCLFLVELYDSFNNGKENSKYNFPIERNGKRYSYSDFINDISSFTNDEEMNQYKCIAKEIISSNSYGNEYGVALVKKSKFGGDRNFIYRVIDFPYENRKAVEITFDVTNFEIENSINSSAQITEIKFIFMHNLFGDKQYSDGKNVLEIRQNNVNFLLEKYNKDAISRNAGVIIMGDFNLHLYSEGSKPIETSANKNNNSFMEIDKKYNFEPQISSLTTIGKDGNVSGNQYDNVLLSSNLIGKVKARAFDYPEIDKIVVSDHIPVYVGLKKLS